MSETQTAPEASGSEDYSAILDQMREADAAPPEAEAPEPEAEEAPEPEQQAQDDEKEKRRRGLVSELQEERERRKAALAEAQREREERAQLAKLVDRLMAGQAPQPAAQPQAPELPPLDTDPVGHFKAKTEALERQVQAMAAQHQQAAAQNDVFAKVAQAEAAFAQATPDYEAAVKHLRSTFTLEEQALGLPPGYMAQSVAAQAIQTGRNPAEVAYQMAQARGYTKAAPKPAADPIETLERGVQASRGVASAAGTTPQGGLTMAEIASWSPDRFAREWAKNEAAIKRVMGA